MMGAFQLRLIKQAFLQKYLLIGIVKYRWKVYLEPCQTSMIKLLCEKSFQIKAISG